MSKKTNNQTETLENQAIMLNCQTCSNCSTDYSSPKQNYFSIFKIFASIIMLLTGIFLNIRPELSFLLFISAYLLSGYPVLKLTLKNIKQGKIFDENFLMTIATLGALFIGEYPEAVAVMLFYQVGEYFQNSAVNKSKTSISKLMDIRPDSARIIKDKQHISVHPSELSVGDIILVKPGEKVPVDGRINKGWSMVDYSSLTGESMPQNLGEADTILSGSVVLNSVLEIQVTTEFHESTVSRIINLVENAATHKAKTERFITRFASWYTPIVVAIAALVAVLPPLIWPDQSFQEWLYRALIFLVISCPCALVVSVPLSFFSGIGHASRQGILVKGANFLEMLRQIDTVFFDKTGTLTKGELAVSKIHSYEPSYTESDILYFAAIAEQNSLHPIAKAILKANSKVLTNTVLTFMEEKSGLGILANTDKHQILLGNASFLQSQNISFKREESNNSVVYVCLMNKHVGSIEIQDMLKVDAHITIEAMKKRNIKTAMLTGDTLAAAKSIGKQLNIDAVYGDLLPQDKYRIVKEAIDKGEKVLFLGDGINDAPVLALAHIGVSMGQLGSDAAIEASDIVFMTDEPSRLMKAMDISNRTLHIVKQNISLALGTKFLIMGLGVLGLSSMWMAIFADVGVSLLAVLNSLRAMK